MAAGPNSSVWQQQMRVRSFRLLGASAPLLMISFALSSLVPHGGSQKDLFRRPWGDALLVKGRFEMPRREGEDIQIAFHLEGPLPPPIDTQLGIRIKSLNGDFESRRLWTFKPAIKAGKSWSAYYSVKLPAGELIAYRLKTEKPSQALNASTLRIISNPERSADRYFRMGELLFYPSLALCALALVMLLFAKFAM